MSDRKRTDFLKRTKNKSTLENEYFLVIINNFI